VTLKSEDGGQIQVPRDVLCAHSPVFTAALNADMLESKSRFVDIPDASDSVLSDLADCLFSGGFLESICTSWRRVLELAVLAQKYAMKPLVEACTFYLCIAMSRDNFCELLMLADKFHLLQLRKAAVCFAMYDNDNLEALTDSDEFEELPADFVRVLMAYSTRRRRDDGGEKAPPPAMQWGSVPREFHDNTDWERLPKDALRRACFERLLCTSGTAAELIDLLSSGKTQEDIVKDTLFSQWAKQQPELAAWTAEEDPAQKECVMISDEEHDSEDDDE